MKIIIDAETMDQIFGSAHPTVVDVLKNKMIGQMIKNCQVVGVGVDEYDANNLGNLVIKVIPSLNKGKTNGK